VTASAIVGRRHLGSTGRGKGDLHVDADLRDDDLHAAAGVQVETVAMLLAGGDLLLESGAEREAGGRPGRGGVGGRRRRRGALRWDGDREERQDEGELPGQWTTPMRQDPLLVSAPARERPV